MGLALGCSPSTLEPTWFDHYERERRVCVGVPPGVSPLEELGIADMRPISSFRGRPRLHRTDGVRLFLRSQPGWNVTRLDREIACRIERMALLAPESRADRDPLAVEGVQAEVRPASGGWELWLTSRRRDGGRELLRRTRALARD